MIVLSVLAIPVPPFFPRTIPVTFEAVPLEIELATKSLTALLLGYFVSKSFPATNPAVVVKFAFVCFKSNASCNPVISATAAAVAPVTKPLAS